MTPEVSWKVIVFFELFMHFGDLLKRMEKKNEIKQLVICTFLFILIPLAVTNAIFPKVL